MESPRLFFAPSEHLATGIVEQVVAETAPLLSGGADSPTIVLGTLAGERHSTGALMAAAVAASEGWRVFYLGGDLPASEVVETARRTGSRAIGVSIVSSERKARSAAELREMEEALDRRTALLVGGSGAAGIREFNEWDRAMFVGTMSDLVAELGALRTGGRTV